MKPKESPFPTLAALRAGHNELMRRVRDTRVLSDTSDSPDMMSEVRDFLARGVATGAVIELEDDRLTAQSLLDYWSAMLYRAGIEPPDTTLAEFDVSAEPTLADSDCPYVGMEPFREANRENFFGRRRLVNEFLVGKVRTTRLIALVGPSGSGKSSVLQAGLVPALKSGALEGSADWRYSAEVTPTDQPLGQLAALLPNGGGPDGADRLRADPTLLAQALDTPGSPPFVLLIDQFEELFTFGNDESVDEPFVAALIALAEAPGARHTVLIGMRSDVESSIPRFAALQSWFERGRVQLLPLGAVELREAIEKPAERVGLKFEPGLVDQLIGDLLGEPGALPLLQFTLLELWERRERNRITWAAYNAIGAGRKAITNVANMVYEGLPQEEQPVARRLLLQLVRLERGQDATTRKVRREALLQAARGQELAERVLDELVEHRLVRVTAGQSREHDQIELSHEALVRNWPKLVDWMERERTTLELRRKLEAQAAEWVRLGRASAGLLDPVQLAEAETWLASPEAQELGFDESLPALVASSRSAIEEAQQQKIRQAETLAEAERQRAEAERQRAEAERQRAEAQARSSRRLGWALIGLGLIFFLAVILAGVAVQQASVAATNARDAVNSSNARATEAIALRTAEAQAKKNADEASRNADEARRQAEEASKNEAIAISAQATAETARIDAERRQREARAGELAALAQAASISSPQLSLLLAVEAVRTTTDRGEPAQNVAMRVLRSGLLQISGRGFFRHADGIAAVVFRKSAGQIVSAGVDGQILIWDSARLDEAPAEIQAGAAIAVGGIVLSGDDRWLATTATASDSIRLIDLSDQKSVRTLAISGEVSQIAMAGSPARLAAAGDDGVTYVWTAGSDEAPRQLRARSPALSVAVSPDGRWVLTGHEDGIARLWDLNRRDPISAQSTTNRRGPLTAVAISPNGRWILIGSEDSDTHMWGLNASGFSSGPYVLAGQSDPIEGIAVSPDSTLAATASSEGVIYLWRIEAKNNPSPRSVLRGHIGSITAMVFTTDSSQLVTTSDDASVGLWDLTQPDPGATERTLYGHDNSVTGAAISADSTLLATVSSDRSLRVWRLPIQLPSEADLPTNPAELSKLACQIVGRNMTGEEWAANVSGSGPLRNTCDLP